MNVFLILMMRIMIVYKFLFSIDDDLKNFNFMFVNGFFVFLNVLLVLFFNLI